MGNKDDRAGEVRQRIGEHIDRSRVEMVGRLVEQQGIGRFDQHPRKRDAIAFPSAQRLDRFLLIVTGEQKGAGNSAEEIRFRLTGDFGEGVENGMFGVQGLCLVLGEVVQGDTMADRPGAFLRRPTLRPAS